MEDDTPARHLRSQEHGPVVIGLTGPVKEALKGDQQKRAEQLGATVLTEVKIKDIQKVTHLLAWSSSFPLTRTLNLMAGLSAGCSILPLEWLTDSLAAGQFLPEGSYTASADTASKDKDFNLAESVRKAQALKAADTHVLSGYGVHILPAGEYVGIYHILSLTAMIYRNDTQS